MDHLSKYLALRIALERRQQQEAGEPGGPGGGTSDATAGPDGGGGEGGGAGGADGPEEPALPSLEGVSEKQYTIYIAPGGGAFTVSGPECRGGRVGGCAAADPTSSATRPLLCICLLSVSVLLPHRPCPHCAPFIVSLSFLSVWSLFLSSYHLFQLTFLLPLPPPL